MLTHKGYIGQVDYDDNAEAFYGIVVNASVLISFRGRTVDDLKTSFSNVVDTYLEDCRAEGRSPEKPYNGKITVRVNPATHRRIAMKAALCRESMNEYLVKVLQRETMDLEETCP
jgi:predicted HicB family RNase H-like nuclease